MKEYFKKEKNKTNTKTYNSAMHEAKHGEVQIVHCTVALVITKLALEIQDSKQHLTQN